jgi:hypothetical protein
MKKMIAAALMLALLTGCTSRTPYGQCIGAFDEKAPDVQYKVDGWNLAMAIIFFETVVVPVVVVATELRCPVATKKPAAPIAQQGK